MSNEYRSPQDPAAMHSTSMTALTPSQIIALIVGVVFTLFGIIGFAVTGTSNFAGAATGDTLLGFELNPLHNVIHLVIGIAGLVLWRTDMSARMYGWLLFVVCGVLFIYGLFVVNSTDAANFLSLNVPDNVLHLVTALIGLVAALLPEESMGSSRGRGMKGTSGPSTGPSTGTSGGMRPSGGPA